MAAADIGALTASKHLQLVAVAEVDDNRIGHLQQRFPHCTIYKDYRILLDKQKNLDSVNVSTPDHMHAPIALRAMWRGLHVYCQKPLTHTIQEARWMTQIAAQKKLVTQMGIQIHSHPVHKQVVQIIQDGAIGKVKQVYSWSGKSWGDPQPRPNRQDPVPAGFDWDLWLGVAAERPFIGSGYYHPGNWRKRLDFGTGTFGDMGCHILDPVFKALALPAPASIRSLRSGPNDHNWPLDVEVHYCFRGTRYTTDPVTLVWYNGSPRPPQEVQKLIGQPLHDQGSIYVGEKGLLYSPYIATPRLLPAEQFQGYKLPQLPGDNHYLQYVEAIRGHATTATPFSYSGPLTELVLLGCLATRFPNIELHWDSSALRFTNHEPANAFVHKTYRRGFEVPGL
jgi:predicted dehydrogenase